VPVLTSSPSFLACPFSASLFFFNATAPTAIYTLSLHDALPILPFRAKSVEIISMLTWSPERVTRFGLLTQATSTDCEGERYSVRSEEHTSELQSRENLVCRLLLEKKKERTTSEKRTESPQRTTN